MSWLTNLIGSGAGLIQARAARGRPQHEPPI